jgi:hypothetical protein
MARVAEPTSFYEQTILFLQIKSKHDADGAASVLNILLAEQNIDLAADDVARAQAVVADTKQSKEFKQAEELREARDQLFTPIFSNHKNMVQFLKTLYKPNYKKLGDWGVEVVGSARIVYPHRFADRINSVQVFVKKFNSLPPAENPIILYLANHPEVAMPTLAQLDTILAIHNDFEQIYKNVEAATEERNALWQPVMAHVRIIADYLKKLFNLNPNKLGRYGFVVRAKRKMTKVRNTNIKLGHKKVISSAVIGGKLFNRGNTELKIYKGRKEEGTPLIVSPGESIYITKGYSSMTIVNSSTTEAANIHVDVKE